MKITIFIVVLFLLPIQGLSQVQSSANFELSRVFAPNQPVTSILFSDMSVQSELTGSRLNVETLPRWTNRYAIRGRQLVSLTALILPGFQVYRHIISTRYYNYNEKYAFIGFLSGIIIGPALGYFFTGEAKLAGYGFRGIGKRIAIGVASLGIAAIIGATGDIATQSSGGTLLVSGVLAVGVIVVFANAIDDVFSLPSRFKEHAETLGLTNISVQPTALYAGNRTITQGLSFSLKF